MKKTIYIDGMMCMHCEARVKKVLEALENHKICFEHLPSGIDTMSVVVSDQDFLPVQESILADIQRKTKADNIFVKV